MAVSLTRSQKLYTIIGISFCFFVAEISGVFFEAATCRPVVSREIIVHPVGFYTHSLALIADAFHYLNDLIGYIVALVAQMASERDHAPPQLSYGWQRAKLLGGFFNGVFLLALGVSIFLQAIERFVTLEKIQNPLLVMIIGAVGFALNVFSILVLHEHDHEEEQQQPNTDIDLNPLTEAHTSSAVEMTRPHASHRHARSNIKQKSKHGLDLGILGVLIHLAGDAVNNIGVIIAGAVIWKAKSPERYYTDPAIGILIAIMICLSSVPLVRKTGIILLQSVPKGVNPDDVKHDMEQIAGVLAVHELHIWRLNQEKSLASAHVITDEKNMSSFMTIANTINECLHAYGIHSATLQPELASPALDITRADDGQSLGVQSRVTTASSCLVGCQTGQCEQLSCCD